MDRELKFKLSLQDVSFGNKMQAAMNQTKQLDGLMSGLGSKLAAAAAGLGVGMLGKSVIEATAKFQGLDNAINTAGGSLKFLNQQTDRLGLDINAAYSGYKTFSGALMGTALAGEKADRIFRQVAEASTVMGLSGDQTEGAFLALGQMISKGKVQAEELRGQLGERIPGAFLIASRAMGMTTAELDKFMADGKLVAEDFLPKFGAELEKQFGSKVGAATQSLQSNLNRLNAEWERLKVTIGTEFLPELLGAVSGLSKFLKENKDLIISGIKLAGVLGAGALAFKTITMGISAYNSISLLAESANASLNLALGTTLSTVGLLAAGFVGLGAAIYGAISSWNEYQDIISGKTNKLTSVDGLNEEITVVDKLTKTYINLGMSKEKALTKAISFEREGLNSDINRLTNQLSTAKEEEKASLRNQILYRMGALQSLDDKSNFGKNITMLGKSGVASTAKASSSPSISSSTEISAARPQSLIININDGLVKNLNINTTNIKEGYHKIREEVSKVLLEACNDANKVPG